MKVAYLDTNVAVWLAQGDLGKITPAAREAIAKSELLLSPMVALELEYLNEIKRIKLPSQDILLKLRAELGVEVCRYGFPHIIDVAIHEKWTRDPFDRVIVAQAKSNGYAPLISADMLIRTNYVKTVWL